MINHLYSDHSSIVFINRIILTVFYSYTYSSILITILIVIGLFNFSQYFLAIICPFLVMRVCHLEKVDQIREHVRELMGPKKRDSESEHKEAQGAAIELEPIGGDAGQARVHLSSSLASPERPLLVHYINYYYFYYYYLAMWFVAILCISSNRALRRLRRIPSLLQGIEQ